MMIAVRIRHTPPDPRAQEYLRERICHQLDLEHGTAAVDKLLSVAAYCSASLPTIVAAYKADILGKETDEPLLDWLDSGALPSALSRLAEATANSEASMDIVTVAEVTRASAHLKGVWDDEDTTRRDAAWHALHSAVYALDVHFCDRIAQFEGADAVRNTAAPGGPLRFEVLLEYSSPQRTVMLQRAHWHLSAEGWVLSGHVHASWLSTPDFNALHRIGSEGSILLHYSDEKIEYVELTEPVRIGWRRTDGTVDLSFMTTGAPTWSPS